MDLTLEYLNNRTGWSCEPHQELYDYINGPYKLAELPNAQRRFQILLYILVCSIGATGNIMILVTFCINPQLRVLSNYFIANLAISDLMLCIFSAPCTLILILNTFWAYGEPACIVVASATAINLFVSTFSLTGIGLHRFAMAKFPVKFRHNTVLPAMGIMLVWFVSLLLSLPVAFGAHTVMLNDQVPNTPWSYKNYSDFQKFLIENCSLPEPEMCIEDWSRHFLSQSVFSLLCSLVQYILPLFTLCLFYWHVGTTAKRSSNLRLRLMRTDDSEGRKQVASNQRRTFILLCCLVAAFGVLWFPWNLYNALANLELINFSMISGFAYVYLCGILTATFNPLLYGLFNENFRSVFKRYWQGISFWNRLSVSRMQNEAEPPSIDESSAVLVPLKPMKSTTEAATTTTGYESISGNDK